MNYGRWKFSIWNSRENGNCNQTTSPKMLPYDRINFKIRRSVLGEHITLHVVNSFIDPACR